ncbi:MAG: RNA polymerase sigma factor, partial [Kiloniellales bacterium]
IRNYRRYAYRVLRNLVRDYVRRSRSGIKTIPFDEEIGSIVNGLPRQAIQMEFRELAEALECLPLTQREVVLLVGLEGLSYEATAEILGLPIGTVMSRLSRGRRALKRRLGKAES